MSAITDIGSHADPDTAKAAEIFSVIANDLLEDMDRPELWEAFPQFLAAVPKLPEQARIALQVYAKQDPAMVQAAVIDLAVFLPEHPEHAGFLAAMADPRLWDRRALIGNLADLLADAV
jgi:hypothetical protein